jgi:hypothetical protein
MRRLSLISALLLVVSLATSAWATCVGELGMTANAEMACCKAGHEHCPMKGTASDCCQIEGQRTQQLSAATAESVRAVVTAPPAIAILYEILVVAVTARVPRFGSARVVGTSSSPPPHLLASALLI